MPSVIKPRATTVTLKLDAVYRDRLKSLAFAKKRTAHYLMKEAIERYLKIEEAQQVVLQSVDDATAHFEMTGSHITLDEVRQWSSELENNPDAKLPVCHL